MKKRITDPVEQWKALLALGRDDTLEPDYPEALVDADLREVGIDPREVEANGDAFVQKLMAERAEAESRKASRTRLRSPPRATSSAPPVKGPSSLPPTRAKVPSDAGSFNNEE